MTDSNVISTYATENGTVMSTQSVLWNASSIADMIFNGSNESQVTNETQDGERIRGIFIQSTMAKGIAGAFAAMSCLLTGYQLCIYLRYVTFPVQQRCIMRILIMVPIYCFCSWLSLMVFGDADYYIYFNTIRDCYEAVVIYSFLCLCYDYLGGEGEILSHISGKPIRTSIFMCTCCLGNRQYNITFLRFCKRATIQFCFVKPTMAVLTLILQAYGVYKEGDFSPNKGYLYITIIYNASISLALYGLFLFYFATKELLRPHKPVMKFLCVKSIIFVSFWQGIVLAILERAKVLNPIYIHNGTVIISVGTVAAGHQNFIICVEMVFASACLWFAFPKSVYEDGKAKSVESLDRGVPANSLRSISSNFKDAINPTDIMVDAIHNFHPNYQDYAQQGVGPASIEEIESYRRYQEQRWAALPGPRRDHYQETSLVVPNTGGGKDAVGVTTDNVDLLAVQAEVMPGITQRGIYSEKTNLLSMNNPLS